MTTHRRRDFLRLASLAVPAWLLMPRRTVGSIVKNALDPVDLGFIGNEMELVRRSGWTATLPRTWLLREAEGYDRLTIHHVGKSVNRDVARETVIQDLENMLTGHMDRDYGDIGYHFAIDHGGRVWEARSLAYEGAHVSGQNRRNIGVVLLGNFEEQEPSDEQVFSMRQVTLLLRDRFGIKQHRIYGHCDIGHSVCPGRNLYPRVMEIKEQG